MDKPIRSGCPINLTLETLGDRWSLIVIRDIMFGNRRTIATCSTIPRKASPRISWRTG
ncbi:winged helix-turn-helix transcriptional regulator [Sulfitobacter porphyrae]|uniref:Winged helix-turn-helix transcriptional regulator n=1 Tax=Sulfitobacter porphyrae TaxID=1246864 RepID=A0ABW2B247_9RHOB